MLLDSFYLKHKTETYQFLKTASANRKSTPALRAGASEIVNLKSTYSWSTGLPITLRSTQDNTRRGIFDRARSAKSSTASSGATSSPP